MSGLIELVKNYLGNGGFFNPELMEHDKVRDMVIALRDEIERLTESKHEATAKTDEVRTHLRFANDRIAKLEAENNELDKVSRRVNSQLLESFDSLAKLEDAIEYFITHEVGDSYLEAALQEVSDASTR